MALAESTVLLKSPVNGEYLKRPPIWWIGPVGKRLKLAAAAAGAKYAANGGIALLILLLGLFANFTVIGSEHCFGVVPFNAWMARSASVRWSKRIKPTPFDRPVDEEVIALESFASSLRTFMRASSGKFYNLKCFFLVCLILTVVRILNFI